ncbi:hypothetical protein M407DRAFT_21975 [Tulasnella calospora MUT 4182]|uniref:Uncharacterized protein n=1 Tax=Tulasnella calospora MUT 4182 TaxID=1051891 RepID=A0A0C3L569_9AGAM|nr:hypothetical protein M407DRAFT_21975 [Tulasnella calospora MUT 4182]
MFGKGLETSSHEAHQTLEVPEIVKFLEMRERRGQRKPRFRIAQKFSLPAFTEPLVWTVCLWLPKIYLDRHRELQTVVTAERDIFTDRMGRLGAASAWEAYCQGMIDEWQSANIITALILSAAGSFLALPDINNASRCALLFSLLSSLASIAHSAFYAHIYRNKLANKHFSIIQLSTYLAYYCFVDNILLCIPLINMFYAIGAFSVSIIIYLWPRSQHETNAGPPTLGLGGSIVLILIFAAQLAFIVISYIASQALTFTTDELLDASKNRELAMDMKHEKEADAAKAAIITSMAVVNDPDYKLDSIAHSSTPARWLRYDWRITEAAIPLGYEDGQPDSYMWEHQQLYVVRVPYEGRYRAGKLGWHIGAKRYMYIPYGPNRSEVMLERADCDILSGVHSDFAWYRVREGERFNVSRNEIPEPWELFAINPTIDRAERAYGGQQLGEVLNGARHASIPFLGEEILITPFLVLLIKKGAMASPDAVSADAFLSPPLPGGVAQTGVRNNSTRASAGSVSPTSSIPPPATAPPRVRRTGTMPVLFGGIGKA